MNEELIRTKSTAGKSVLVFVGVALLTLTALGVLSYFGQAAQQSPTTYLPHPTPLIDFRHLNASTAKQLGIHGFLTIGSALSGGQSVTTSPGQTIQVTIRLTWVSFDSTVSSIAVTFLPEAGQYAVGQFDVSSREVFTPSTVNVSSAQPATVVLSFQVPSNANPMTFRLLPRALALHHAWQSSKRMMWW